MDVTIHQPKIKGLDKWTRKDGTTYYCLTLIDSTGSTVYIFIDDIDQFIAALVTTPELNCECSS